MRNTKDTVAVLLFALFSLHLSTAIAGSNYMRCNDFGLFVGDCHLEHQSLFAESKSEREFSVDYRFFCDGHKIDVGFQTDKGFTGVDSSANHKHVSLAGHSLKLFDRDPRGTLRSTFDSSCVFEIIGSSVDLSQHSRDLLRNMREESNLIVDSVGVFSVVSKATGSMVSLIVSADMNSLVWQRDQMRLMLARIDLDNLPRATSIVFAANLRMLDQMAREHTDELNVHALAEKLYNIANNTFNAISEQQIKLLNRIEELRLRATEILVEAGQANRNDWSDLFHQLDKAKQVLNTANE